MMKKYRRKNRLKEIEARSYAMKARMNHEKLVAKKNSPPKKEKTRYQDLDSDR
jgi:hypothetical protein